MSAIGVPCPLCGARPGERCRTEGPGWSTTPHAAREALMRDIATENKQRRALERVRRTSSATPVADHPKG